MVRINLTELLAYLASLWFKNIFTARFAQGAKSARVGNDRSLRSEVRGRRAEGGDCREARRNKLCVLGVFVVQEFFYR